MQEVSAGGEPAATPDIPQLCPAPEMQFMGTQGYPEVFGYMVPRANPALAGSPQAKALILTALLMVVVTYLGITAHPRPHWTCLTPQPQRCQQKLSAYTLMDGKLQELCCAPLTCPPTGPRI